MLNLVCVVAGMFNPHLTNNRPSFKSSFYLTIIIVNNINVNNIDYLYFSKYICHVNQKQRQRLYNLLGANVKKYRSQKGLTQGQLANEIALTRTSIVNIEQGRQHPPLYLLFDIAKVLDVDLHILIPNETAFLNMTMFDEESLKDVARKDVSKLTSFVTDFMKTTGSHE